MCRRLFLRVVWSLGDPEDYVYVERGARTSDRLLVTRSSLLPVVPPHRAPCTCYMCTEYTYSLHSTREPRVMCTTPTHIRTQPCLLSPPLAGVSHRSPWAGRAFGRPRTQLREVVGLILRGLRWRDTLIARVYPQAALGRLLRERSCSEPPAPPAPAPLAPASGRFRS